jgi:hypothetical protein
MSPALGGLQVVVEVGHRRTFASVLDWPGWCRSGRTTDAALETLADYAPRYSPVAVAAGLTLPSAEVMTVIETVSGDATTEFGAPSIPASAEFADLAPAEAARLADLLVACWNLLEDVRRHAPEVLRKGPRGGGRDRDAVVQHVLGAEASYARKLGLRAPAPAFDDETAVIEFHAALAAMVRNARQGQPSGSGWPPRYLVRRIAWHVLDHAWEIEDRSS